MYTSLPFQLLAEHCLSPQLDVIQCHFTFAIYKDESTDQTNVCVSLVFPSTNALTVCVNCIGAACESKGDLCYPQTVG